MGKIIKYLYFNDKKLKTLAILNKNLSANYTWRKRVKKIIKFYND